MYRYKRIIFLLFDLCVFHHYVYGGATKPVYSIDLETSLRQELFTNYEVLQRPAEKVNVHIGLNVLTVNDLNIKDQVLSISGYLTMIWIDSRLSWLDTNTTTQDYTNVRFLFSTEEYVWRPSLIIENSVSEISIISDKTNPMRIQSSGAVIWSPAGIYEVSCESDTTYYPLDTQECTVKVTSWAYTATEVTLIMDSIDLTYYSANGEWDLISATGVQPNDKSRGGITFAALEYTLKLRRRPMFHVVNTLFPVALMAVLIAMVFKLSLESGEKIGFSLTVLLAYAVYLTMISDNIPSTSVTVCYLSLYLVFILSLAAISVILTIFVLNLHFKTDEPIPNWVKTITRTCLVRVACIKTCQKCERKSKINDSQLFTKTEKPFPMEEKKGTMVEPQTEQEEGEDLTWQKLAIIMDKVFFTTYMFLIVLSTFILFVLILANY